MFDDRWSRSHFWSAAPTWQLSRYVLGLHPVLDEAGTGVRLALNTCGLSHARGQVPLPGGGSATVSWHEQDGSLTYSLEVSQPVRVVGPGGPRLLDEGHHELALTHGHGDRFLAP